MNGTLYTNDPGMSNDNHHKICYAHGVYDKRQ